MSEITIYHNPRCTKSRKTLDLIKNNNIEPTVIFYLEKKITYQELKNIILKLRISPRDLLRKGEVEYKENNLGNTNLSDDEIINFMINFPKLIERPIVIKGDEAIIGRPPENVLKLII
ncbi:MAG: arsenate reductase (glutaredoxin) [Gammaproteobacteria bacterium]|nr:arsenate reductase (glutaredoxin) [Gammaproteobacteria bacterium]|tara:strand:+ start:944 stop:1297 length:354 start_codon:yes stop_codon:yes gene_type:complete